MGDTRKGKGPKIARGTAKPRRIPLTAARTGAMDEVRLPEAISAGVTEFGGADDVASLDEFTTASEAASPAWERDSASVAPLPPSDIVPHAPDLPNDLPIAAPQEQHAYDGFSRIATASLGRTADEWLALQDRMLGIARLQREAGLSMLGSMLGATTLSEAIEAQTRAAGEAINVAASHWLELAGKAQHLMGATTANPSPADKAT